MNRVKSSGLSFFFLPHCLHLVSDVTRQPLCLLRLSPFRCVQWNKAEMAEKLIFKKKLHCVVE